MTNVILASKFLYKAPLFVFQLCLSHLVPVAMLLRALAGPSTTVVVSTDTGTATATATATTPATTPATAPATATVQRE